MVIYSIGINNLMEKMKYKNGIDVSTTQSAMTISESSQAKVFAMLSTSMYANPVAAICRELISNGLDACTVAGVERRVKVVVDNLGTTINFIDNGCGMTDAEIVMVFANYLASTKDTSNEQIGGFGIGGKTPFAYTDSFIVKSVSRKTGKMVVYEFLKEGQKHIYRARKDLVEEQFVATEKDYGTTVSFDLLQDTDAVAFRSSISKLWEFSCSEVTFYYKGDNFSNIAFRKTKYKCDLKIAETDDGISASFLCSTPHINTRTCTQFKPFRRDVYFLLGDVAYNSKDICQSGNSKYDSVWEIFEQVSTALGLLQKEGKLIIRLPIGSVDVNTSREGLIGNNRLADAFLRILKEILLTIINKNTLKLIKAVSQMKIYHNTQEFRRINIDGRDSMLNELEFRLFCMLSYIKKNKKNTTLCNYFEEVEKLLTEYDWSFDDETCIVPDKTNPSMTMTVKPKDGYFEFYKSVYRKEENVLDTYILVGNAIISMIQGERQWNIKTVLISNKTSINKDGSIIQVNVSQMYLKKRESSFLDEDKTVKVYTVRNMSEKISGTGFIVYNINEKTINSIGAMCTDTDEQTSEDILKKHMSQKEEKLKNKSENVLKPKWYKSIKESIENGGKVYVHEELKELKENNVNCEESVKQTLDFLSFGYGSTPNNIGEREQITKRQALKKFNTDSSFDIMFDCVKIQRNGHLKTAKHITEYNTEEMQKQLPILSEAVENKSLSFTQLINLLTIINHRSENIVDIIKTVKNKTGCDINYYALRSILLSKNTQIFNNVEGASDCYTLTKLQIFHVAKKIFAYINIDSSKKEIDKIFKIRNVPDDRSNYASPLTSNIILTNQTRGIGKFTNSIEKEISYDENVNIVRRLQNIFEKDDTFIKFNLINGEYDIKENHKLVSLYDNFTYCLNLSSVSKYYKIPENVSLINEYLTVNNSFVQLMSDIIIDSGIHKICEAANVQKDVVVDSNVNNKVSEFTDKIDKLYDNSGIDSKYLAIKDFICNGAYSDNNKYCITMDILCLIWSYDTKK